MGGIWVADANGAVIYHVPLVNSKIGHPLHSSYIFCNGSHDNFSESVEEKSCHPNLSKTFSYHKTNVINLGR